MEDDNKAEEDNRKESSSSNNIAIDKEPPSSDNTQQDVDPAKFPIMHRYRIPVNCTIMIYTLIQELSKLHGGKHIDFSHGSNRHVLLLQVPTSSNRYQFNRLVVEDGNISSTECCHSFQMAATTMSVQQRSGFCMCCLTSTKMSLYLLLSKRCIHFGR